MLDTNQLKEENRLLKEQLEIVKQLQELTKQNQYLKLPNRVNYNTWDLLTGGGCTAIS